MTDIPIPLPGETLTAGDLHAFGEWFTWTPALTVLSGTNPVLGSGGSTAGQWHNNAGLVTAQFDVFFGSSGVNPGNGIYALNVPVALDPSWDPRLIVGQVALWDASGPLQQSRTIRFVTTTRVVFTSEAGANVTQAVPWTWAINDHLHGMFTYRGVPA